MGETIFLVSQEKCVRPVHYTLLPKDSGKAIYVNIKCSYL